METRQLLEQLAEKTIQGDEESCKQLFARLRTHNNTADVIAVIEAIQREAQAGNNHAVTALNLMTPQDQYKMGVAYYLFSKQINNNAKEWLDKAGAGGFTSAFYYLGVIHNQSKNYAEAIDCFQHATESEESRNEALSQLSDSYYNAGMQHEEKNPEKAVEYYYLFVKCAKVLSNTSAICQRTAGLVDRLTQPVDIYRAFFVLGENPSLVSDSLKTKFNQFANTNLALLAQLSINDSLEKLCKLFEPGLHEKLARQRYCLIAKPIAEGTSLPFDLACLVAEYKDEHNIALGMWGTSNQPAAVSVEQDQKRTNTP